MGMTTPDPRIVLRGREVGTEGDPIVDHPTQPRDYIHSFPDGPVWTWHQEWRVVGGVRLRVYELMPRITLRDFESSDPETGVLNDLIVDHPGQPADYVQTDGTVWTWRHGWRPLGGGRYMRVYVLAAPRAEGD